MLSYDAIVASLRDQGVPAALAEATARRELKLPELPPAENRERENALEKAEQWEIVKLFKAFGFEVYWLSQSRASKQTPGLPDLWCMHREQPIAFWFETKRTKGGRFSEPQRVFLEHAERCHVGYVWGDRSAARAHLITLGLAHVIGGVLEPLRPVRTEGHAAD
jgi:hypothetical protein